MRQTSLSHLAYQLQQGRLTMIFKKTKKQVRWIIGGSSGIGYELAKRYLQAGDRVCIFAHDQVEDAVSTLTEYAAKSKKGTEYIKGYQVDVLDTEQLEEVFRAAEQALSLPATVINSAGIAIAKSFEDMSESEFKRQIDVNLVGSRNVAYTALPYLKEARNENKQPAKLVLMSSMAGLIPCYGYAGYCASKYGVIGLADVLRMELSKQEGIDVAVICPPEVETPLVFEERRVGSPITKQLKQIGGSLSVEVAVDEILAGIRGNEFFIIPGKQARKLYHLSRLMPMIVRKQVDKKLAQIISKSA